MRRVILTLSFAMALVWTTAGAASAHYIYDSGITYASSNDCAYGYSETSHGTGGGYSKSYILAEYHFSSADCAVYWKRPVGYLAVAFDLYKWTGSSWALCRYTNWYYNSTDTSQFILYAYYGSSPPCGNGYYATYGGNFEYNGGWHGGWLWSGYHYLPA